jgi:hypothetical protein
MIIMNATNERLLLTLSAAANLNFIGQYNRIATPQMTGVDTVATSGSLTTAATHEIVPFPTSGNVHQVKAFFAVNVHATTATDVTIKKEQAGTPFQIHPKFTLAAGEGFAWIEGRGLVLYNADGTEKAPA